MIRHLTIILIFATNFIQAQKVFELVGTIRAESGEFLCGVDVSLWQNGEMINSVETNVFGDYTMPLFKTGTFHIIVAGRIPYYHQQELESFMIHTITTFNKDFKLKSDQHRLKHVCTRLVEADNQMKTNPKNEDYKQLYFKNFPSNSLMIELFFNKANKKVNLNKSEEYYFKQFFDNNLVGNVSYVQHFIGFSKTAYPNKKNPFTEMYRQNALKFCKEIPEDLFRELSTFSSHDVEVFWKFLFYHNSSPDAIPKEFMPFQSKYGHQFNILMGIFE
jgi:hypothetical protein